MALGHCFSSWSFGIVFRTLGCLLNLGVGIKCLIRKMELSCGDCSQESSFFEVLSLVLLKISITLHIQ